MAAFFSFYFYFQLDLTNMLHDSSSSAIYPQTFKEKRKKRKDRKK
jgi:hypothetical protein